MTTTAQDFRYPAGNGTRELGRADYEALCAEYDVAPRTDDEIGQKACSLRTASHDRDEWANLGREGRVQHIISGWRLRQIDATSAAESAARLDRKLDAAKTARPERVCPMCKRLPSTDTDHHPAAGVCDRD